MITTYDWIEKTTERMKVADIATARLDSMILLEDTTGKDRAWLLAHPEFVLSPQTLNKLEECVKKRLAHEPIAYIRGKCEFYGREFIVNPHTLQPRSETETMITLLNQLLTAPLYKGVPCTVVDVGTGSGCLAVTAGLEYPNINIFATDIDQKCIATAKINARKYKTDIKFFHGDLLQPVSSILTPRSYLLCNLPYVPDSHTINDAAMFEPNHAIFGGHDGLDVYRRLFRQVNNNQANPRFVLTESLPFQHEELTKIAKSTAGYKLQKTEDFIQIFRFGA